MNRSSLFIILIVISSHVSANDGKFTWIDMDCKHEKARQIALQSALGKYPNEKGRLSNTMKSFIAENHGDMALREDDKAIAHFVFIEEKSPDPSGNGGFIIYREQIEVTLNYKCEVSTTEYVSGSTRIKH